MPKKSVRRSAVITLPPEEFTNPSLNGFVVRICPPRMGSKFFYTIRTHKVGNSSFQCCKEIINQKWSGNCILCSQWGKFYSEYFEKEECDPMAWFASAAQGTTLGKTTKPRFYPGTIDEFKQHMTDLKPIERYYFNVIIRGEEELGVRKWSCGKPIYNVILEGMLGNPKNVNVPVLGDITDPKKGYDLHVRNGLYRSDIVNTSAQFLPTSPLGTRSQIKRWFDQLYDLTALRHLKSDEEMLSALENTFGYLGPVNPNQKYRFITDPWEPAW